MSTEAEDEPLNAEPIALITGISDPSRRKKTLILAAIITVVVVVATVVLLVVLLRYKRPDDFQLVVSTWNFSQATKWMGAT